MANKKPVRPQVKFYMDAVEFESLTKKAKQYGRENLQDLIRELLTYYLNLWEQAEIVRRHKMEQQFDEFIKKIEIEELTDAELSNYQLGNEFVEYLAQKLSNRKKPHHRKGSTNNASG